MELFSKFSNKRSYNIRRAAKLEISPEPSIKAFRFYCENKDIDFLHDEPGVGIRVVEVDTGSGIQTTLRVVIEIDERTTTREIKKAIPFITKLRDRLLKFQGADLSVIPEDMIREALSNLQERGEGCGYGSLAKKMGMEKRTLRDKLRTWRKNIIHKSIKEIARRRETKRKQAMQEINEKFNRK